MSLNKKEFAKVFSSSLEEADVVKKNTKNIAENLYLSSEKIEDNLEYRYTRYMEKLVASKMKRLYSILSVPARKRILSMSDNEVEEYRNEKISELSSEINRLMFSIEVSKTEIEKKNAKEKVEMLMLEQNRIKDIRIEDLKKDIISKLNLTVENKILYDFNEETAVLENITKDKDTLTKFFNMFDDYKKLEREIKTIRGEQIIIYNDLIANNVKSEYSIDELFSEESLTGIQKTIAECLTDVVDAESRIKKDFGSKMKKSYSSIKSYDYKYSKSNDVLPYAKNALENLKDMMLERNYEFAILQNEEWIRLNSKIFKTTDVNERIASLSMEIDETKSLIDLDIRKHYEEKYSNNSLFGPISSRANGKFEYSLGAKDALTGFIKYGVWPTESEINSLKLAIKLNKIESEKSIIYAEQIKERMSRLYNDSVKAKKKELEDLENRMIELVGNFKNEVILNILNEVR